MKTAVTTANRMNPCQVQQPYSIMSSSVLRPITHFIPVSDTISIIFLLFLTEVRHWERDVPAPSWPSYHFKSFSFLAIIYSFIVYLVWGSKMPTRCTFIFICFLFKGSAAQDSFYPWAMEKSQSPMLCKNSSAQTSSCTNWHKFF